jgi:hypothetical protein
MFRRWLMQHWIGDRWQVEGGWPRVQQLREFGGGVMVAQGIDCWWSAPGEDPPPSESNCGSWRERGCRWENCVSGSQRSRFF